MTNGHSFLFLSLFPFCRECEYEAVLCEPSHTQLPLRIGNVSVFLWRDASLLRGDDSRAAHLLPHVLQQSPESSRQVVNPVRALKQSLRYRIAWASLLNSHYHSFIACL